MMRSRTLVSSAAVLVVEIVALRLLGDAGRFGTRARDGFAAAARVPGGIDQRLLEHEGVELVLVLEIALLLA